MRSLLAGALLTAMAVSSIAAVPAIAQNPGRGPTGGAGASCASRVSGESLVGSRWTGRATWADGQSRMWVATFRADCVLEYSYEGTTYTNGRWLQRGSMVVWDTNDYFALYSGTVNGRSMSGAMRNEGGFTGTWSFTRTN